MKLLSIAIPCYNSQDYMENCIESLLVGGEEVEILIVDDGSSDRTAEIADAYARKEDVTKKSWEKSGTEYIQREILMISHLRYSFKLCL